MKTRTKRFEKGVGMLLVLFLMLLLSLPTLAASDITVYVTVANCEMNISQKPVSVHDRDADGIFTVDEVLFAAHEQYFEGGAAAGYETANGDYGLYIVKLFGTENGGSYGYYLNGASASGLLAPVTAGAYLDTFAYTDLSAFSDLYCAFTPRVATVTVGEPLSLSLIASGYDENWNPVALPVADAVLTVNGADGVGTDDAGAAVLSFDKAGVYEISAKKADTVLVPPCCIVTVMQAPEGVVPPAEQTPQKAPLTGAFPALMLAVAGGASLLTAFALHRRRHD